MDWQAVSNILASDDTVSEFFQEERSILPQAQDIDLASVATMATIGRTTAAFNALRRTFSTASWDSVNLTGVQHFKIEQLCQFIAEHPSLQSATIVSCSCYTEPTLILVIPHRFLVLELHRKGRRNVWLRLDRRPAANVGVLKFSASLGVTPSNDTAVIASSLSQLLELSPAALEESQLAFKSPCSLSDLRTILLDITAVMKQYKLTSANCWAYCSLLLEYFTQEATAYFQMGRIRFSNIAAKAKTQLSHRRKVAKILSPHDTSKFIPFSVLFHRMRTRGPFIPIKDEIDAAIEAASRWEDSDGFQSPNGQLLAGRLIQSLKGFGSLIHGRPNSQLSLQTTALCHQVAACAGPSWPMLGPDVCNGCVDLLYWHGEQYLRRQTNATTALLLLEEATSLLVPGLTENWSVGWLYYRHAVVLHGLGRVDEARVVVMEFIESARHQQHLRYSYIRIKELRSRGIWPSEFDYLLDLQDGDLPPWDNWHQDQSKPGPLLPSPLSKSLLPISFGTSRSHR